MKEKIIKIGDNEYLIKKSYRSLLEFEEMTGKSVTEIGKTIKDLLIFFFCMLKANNKITFNFIEFLDLIDKYPESVDEFNEYILSTVESIDTEDKKKE